MDLAQLPHFAILSGLFGTAASVFGKFISYSDEFIENIPIDTSQTVSNSSFGLAGIKFKIAFLLRNYYGDGH